MENLNEALIIEVNAGSPRLAMMERCLEDVIDDKNTFFALEEFRKLFNLEFKPTQCKKITIVEGKGREEFFGASVLPDLAYLEGIVQAGLSVNTMRFTDQLRVCTIELDSRLIEDCGLTARELMAIILHEAGHTLSDIKMVTPRCLLNDILMSKPFKFFNINPESFYAFGGGLLMMPLLSIYAHGANYWVNVAKEKEADTLAHKCGYGADLSTALGKLIVTNQTMSACASSDKDAIKKMGKWSLSTIVNLRNRQNNILKLLKAQLKEENSPAARELLSRQIQALENTKKSSNPLGAMMMREQKEEEFYNESIRSFIQLHKDGMSVLELDEIEVEIGRIETTDDKIYLLQRIHRASGIARRTIDQLKRSGRYVDKARIEELQTYIKDLKALVPKIKAVRTELNPFNVVVKYPKGDYEGGYNQLE